jgi:hypothetical protein
MNERFHLQDGDGVREAVDAEAADEDSDHGTRCSSFFSWLTRVRRGASQD